MTNRTIFNIHMLPASEGDCFLVEWGDGQCPQRMLIDGGRARTYERQLKPILRSWPMEQKRLRLLVVTHVDRDHIEGVIAMANDRNLALSVDEVWFNNYDNLLSDAPLRSVAGAAQGEKLTERLRRLGWPRNTAFGGGAVSTRSAGMPVKRPLGGGMDVTLLSPDRSRLWDMESVWRTECERAGLIPGGMSAGELAETEAPARPALDSHELLSLETLAARKTPLDRKAANGTSIAFMLEYQRQRVLFAADAHPDLLLDAIAMLGFGPTNPLELAAFKLSHHGSSGNTTRPLLDAIRCQRFLVSTNGTYFRHPDIEALARVITSSEIPRTLYFNYRSKETLIADRDDWRIKYHFDTVFGSQEKVVTIAIPLPGTTAATDPKTTGVGGLGPPA
jgi:beta-lactamase superfamily II metal-dependent hydrolase